MNFCMQSKWQSYGAFFYLIEEGQLSLQHGAFSSGYCHFFCIVLDIEPFGDREPCINFIV